MNKNAMDTEFFGHPAMNDRFSAVAAPRSYPLGYSEGEFRRLEQQGTFFGDLTEDVLRRAGIRDGMSVLDIGCGVGDVSLLAARMVGPSGAVLGVDRSADALNIARKRAAVLGYEWVRFSRAEIDRFFTHIKFDALIGRLVLMYLPDTAAVLRRLCGHLYPGGIVAFQEIAAPLVRSIPDGPQFRQCRSWILDTFERAGFENDMGGKLYATFLDAGLPAPELIAAGRVEGGPDSQVYDYLASILRSLLPMTQSTGVATADEVEIDTLAERLREEIVESNACIMLPPLVGAWTRKPA